MSDSTDSLIEPCASHPDCTLTISSSVDNIRGGEQVQITAAGAHGTVDWLLVTGTSSLDTTTGNVVTLTGSNNAETVLVAAIDSLGCTATLEITICNASIRSQTIATSPADRARLKIGVGEEVELTASQGPATWQVTSGVGTLSPSEGTHQTVTFTAGENAGDVTITATGSPCVSTITFNVVEPSDFTMIRKPGTRVLHGGYNGSTNTFLNIIRPDCGWLGNILVHPNDVNFYRLRIRERDSRSVTTGSLHIPLYNNQLHGNYSSGYSPWFPLGRHQDSRGSLLASSGIVDKIYINCIPSIFGNGPTFSPGTLQYDIVWQWKVGGNGTPRNFPTIRQHHTLTANGTCTSNKAGNSESAAYNSPLQSWQ
jgi:hypothetical protein